MHNSLIDFLTDKRIRIIRAPNQKTWELSKSFNLALRFVRKDKILKLDADIVLKDNFFTDNFLGQNEFIRGNWKNARNENELSLNGVLFAHTQDILQAGGYNEIIKTWGYDDVDLYSRLSEQSLIPKDLNIDTLFHIHHSDEERLKHQAGVIKRSDENVKNKKLAEQYLWNKKKKKSFFWIRAEGFNQYSAIEIKFISYLYNRSNFKNLDKTTPTETRA